MISVENSLPRLLLVSEATLDEKSTGLNRTLFNLLAHYSPDHFMLCAPEDALQTNPPAPPFGQYVTSFPCRFSLPWRNRIVALFSSLLDLLNLQLIDLFPVPNTTKISSFAPEIVLICPNGPLGLLMGYKIAKFLQCPYLVYLMDDWIATQYQQWLGGSIQAYCYRLLKDSNGWMVISSQLEQSLIERYGVKPRQSLVIHNPVDLLDKELPNFTPHQRETFRIAYAGSIWNMHYDAIAVIAQAVSELRQVGQNIELVLYTQDEFWSAYQDSWESWGVIYGGLIPYVKLHHSLQQADLLLVASSFLPQYANITRSSVQTKITDYMATGRLILSCGPSSGACNDFIKKWNCGVVCETQNLVDVKGLLLDILKAPERFSCLAENAYGVVKSHFEINRVRSKLNEFIQQTMIEHAL
jgi:glycosyltransferase involved in cell wall biosynthesis